MPQHRRTVQELIDVFLTEFPKGFYDQRYIGDLHHGERAYKWHGHERFEEFLGGNKIMSLLRSDMPELIHRTFKVFNGINLLYPVEEMAFKDALKDQGAATRFFERLDSVLRAKELTETAYAPYCEAVLELPADRARVASWPVATVLPFLAQPDRHMLLKPNLCCKMADAVGFNLHYDSKPNWLTYSSLLKMAHTYREQLAYLKPRDLLDVQSFFYVATGGWKKA